jgi:hypothetical protein
MIHKHETIFLRRDLRSPGLERQIAGISHRDERIVEVSLFIHGDRRGGLQITSESAPVVAQALERARTSTASQQIGRFADGRFVVDVATGSHPCGSTAVYFQRVAEDGHAGRPVSLFGEELDALEAGLAWLAGDA